MKITAIDVERFGVWNRFRLPLNDGGLTVFYGPNEAGKTTLMRFVRGVLYGYRPEEGLRRQGRTRYALQSGALDVEHNRIAFDIRRISQGTGPGLVAVGGVEPGPAAEHLLEELLSETDASVFESVYALGLQELQELATLHDDEVAGQMYALTLGPEGRQLLGVQQKIEAARNELLDPERNTGELADLFEYDDALSSELLTLEGQREQHRALCLERHRRNAAIADLKGRQAGLQSQLRGHLYLERVWGPWKQVREFRAELAALPVVASFPEDGVEELDRLEGEIGSLERCREAVLQEAKQFRRAAEELEIDSELRQHTGSVQGLLDQRPWLGETRDRLTAADEEARAQKFELDRQIERLGGRWSIERLEQIDRSPAAQIRMVQQARVFQAALVRRGRLRRRYERLADACHQRELDLKEELRAIDPSADSAEGLLAGAREQLARVQDLAALRLAEAQLEQQQFALDEQLGRLDEPFLLPKWAYGVLAFFAIAGVGLALAGLVTGITTSAVIGTIYALLGVTAGGITWALKTQFENNQQETTERLRDRRRENEIALRELHESMQRLVEAGPKRSAAEAGSDADRIALASQRIIELEQLAARQQRIQRVRRRLSLMRAKFQTVQRSVTTARKTWCELLVQMGLDETVRIDDAFQTWQHVLTACDQKDRWNSARVEWQRHRDAIEAFRRRVEEIGHRMQRWNLDYSRPEQVLVQWEQELRSFGENRRERQRLKQEEQARRDEAAEYRTKLDELKLQRSALLVQGGAADRETFEQRSQWLARRRELEELLAEANAELDAAAKTEPELAIVEEDLLLFDSDENGECIHTLNLELEDLDHDLQRACETLGRLKHEIETLESDRRATKLRCERERVAGQIREAAERLFAIELAAESIEEIRARFERSNQPALLAAASPVLSRLTGGKYRTIWTPLGKRHLCVDDDAGNSLAIEHLSGGTREQLFLALRFALVEEFARKGIELPMVLDDVFVNFDQMRTEAAVDTLIDFARQGHQVLLFTCHLHLAHLFEQRGIIPQWLPSHHGPLLDSDPAEQTRRAG